MGKEARTFYTVKNYAVNDLVLYGGVLYRFISAHSAGAWNPSHVTEVDDDEEQLITRIVGGASNAERATAYAGTVIFEPTQITENRYKYIFTNAADPRD